jgi:trans-aconitate methyltransferase
MNSEPNTRHALSAAFFSTFAPHLSETVRWRAFLYIVDELLRHGRPVTILETGTTRDPGNWAGDGNATAIWGWLAKRTGGTAYSIDIDPKACEAARGLACGVNVLEGDSLDLMRAITPKHHIDLLYLDSFDWTPSIGARAALHHSAELARVWDALPSGCLVAVDDCHSVVSGKHVLVAAFFDLLGVKPEVESYVTIWRKP